MGFCATRLGGGTRADDGAANNQTGSLVDAHASSGLDQRAVNLPGIVTVDRPDHPPAVGAKAGGGVITEPVLDCAVDRNAVVIVERNQFGEFPGSGKRTHFVADAFHQATIANKGIGVMINQWRQALAVICHSKQALGKRHAHRIGKPLAKRTGGGLNPRRNAVLGMPRGEAM